MAHSKSPSLFNDRGGIGSSEELDEYGVWVKSEPEDLSFLEDDTGNFPSFEDTGMADLGDFGNDEFSSWENAGFNMDDLEAEDINVEDFNIDDLDLDLQTEDTAQADDDGAETAGELDDLTFSSLEDLGLMPDDMGIPPENKIEDGEEAAAPLPDFFASEPDTIIQDAVEEPPPAPAPAVKEEAPAISTQLLMQIANELSTIKSELSNLKEELSVVRESQGEHPPVKSEGGFFAEEEDATISLAGDEPDPVMPQMDLEEPLEEALFAESAEPELAPQEENDLILSDDFFKDIGAVDEDLEPDLPALPAGDSEDMDLELLAEEVSGAGDAEPDIADSPKAALDTGDTAALDDELFDPGDLSIELDMEEDSITSVFEETPDDLSFDAFSEEDLFEQVIPEGFSVESPAMQPGLPEEAAAEETAPLEEAAGEPPAAEVEMKAAPEGETLQMPVAFKRQLRTVLSYMDNLLESLPENKIEEFAKSEQFEAYKKIFAELGLV